MKPGLGEGKDPVLPVKGSFFDAALLGADIFSHFQELVFHGVFLLSGEVSFDLFDGFIIARFF